MMQEAADRTVTWQSQWHVKTSMASMKHPPGVRGGGEEQGARQVKAERGGVGGREEEGHRTVRGESKKKRGEETEETLEEKLRRSRQRSHGRWRKASLD